jgi:mono/diheme cytochrome c family protein
VTFNAAGQQGDVRKTIAVVTTDPVKPRTILTIKAKVLPPANPRVSAGHPPIQGQSLLGAGCADCHAKPASGKTGEALYAAVCAMCHGGDASGALAHGLRDPDYLASRDDRALADAIAFGTANPRMPGFSVDMGGPLTPAQIDSIVRQLRAWGPASRRPATKPPTP